MSYYRTKETRELQSRLIRQWKPWEKSTGPKTLEGRHRAAMRGYKGGSKAKAKGDFKGSKKSAEGVKGYRLTIFLAVG